MSLKMLHYLIAFCIICAVSASPIEDVPRAGKKRIYYGEPIDIEDAPYQVSIYNGIQLRHMCGGSIISPNVILTAAHCAELPFIAYRIRAGSTSMIEGGELHSVIQVIKHEKYGLDAKGVPSNDLALMKVVPPFNLTSTTKPVGLFEQGEKASIDDDAFLTGWGHTERGRASERLLSLHVNIYPRETCDKNYSHFNGIRDGQICAGYPTGKKDLCNGDSGGPLVINGRQAGIVSWSGPGCAVPGRPGVYTEVAAYRDWIEKHL